MNNRKWFEDVLKKARAGVYTEGVYYTHPNEQGFSIVLGWQDGYEKDDDLIQQEDGGKIWTLCGKVAYNTDDLQCDYEIDWYMPSDKNGNIYIAEMAVEKDDDYEWLDRELNAISIMFDHGELFKN